MRSNYTGDYFQNDNYNQIIIGFYILFTLPGLLLNLICETFLNGQSFGKMILGIKVIKEDGSQANFSSQLLRSMFRIVDHMFVGLISVAVTDKSQRLGDLVAKTLVVRVNHKYSIHNTILYRQVQAYNLVYNQVALMNDEEVNIIKEVIDFSYTQNQPEHINKLAKKLQVKYGITSVSTNNADFLNTLLKDYSYYNFEK